MVVKARKPKAILVDLEGTSSKKNFFAETLVPYVKRRLSKYLDREWETPEIMDAVEELRIETRKQRESDPNAPVVASRGDSRDVILGSVVRFMKYSLNNNIFSDEALLIFFHVWIYGLQKNEVKTGIFEDVADAFKDWKDKHIKIYSISSGRKEAQMMMYVKTTNSSLLSFIHGFFDTTVGKKTESKTYDKIARHIRIDCQEILFLTDDHREARAAKQAGCAAVLVSRPGNSPIPSEISEHEEFNIIKAFDDIRFK